MDLARVAEISEMLATALERRGYSLSDLFKRGLGDDEIDRICRRHNYQIPNWLRPFYTRIDGDLWQDGKSNLLLVPSFTINSLSRAIKASKIIEGFRGESIPAKMKKPFCFMSEESFRGSLFIDLKEYEARSDGLVYGFGPELLTDDLKMPVAFDDYISCFRIMASSIEAGISPCEWPGTDEEEDRFSELALRHTKYKDSLWKIEET